MEKDTKIILISGIGVVIATGVILYLKYRANAALVAAASIPYLCTAIPTTTYCKTSAGMSQQQATQIEKQGIASIKAPVKKATIAVQSGFHPTITACMYAQTVNAQQQALANL